MLLQELHGTPLISKDSINDYKSQKKIASLHIDSASQLTILEYIKKNCGQAYTNMKKSKFEKVIYRGMTMPGFEAKNYYFFDTTRVKRKSANTKNYFTSLTTILPSWKKWPKRDECLVCSSRAGMSSGYGELFVVLPFDNTPIAIAAADDIWYSFRRGVKNNLNQFNKQFYDVVAESIDFLQSKKIEVPEGANIITNRENIGATLLAIDTAIKQFPSMKKEDYGHLASALNNLPHYKEKKWSGIAKYLDYILSPSQNGNVLSSTADWYFAPNREMWFSGKCIIINEEEFKQLVKVDRKK